MTIFIKELLALYHSYYISKDNPLPQLRIQYKDYTGWQRKFLEVDSGKATKLREYWHKKLSGEIPVLKLPVDFARPAAATYEGRDIYFTLNKNLTAGIHQLCTKYECSLFMILLSFFKILLYRYTGEEDILVGSPTAGRDHPDLEDQLGCYVNTLVLRDRVEGSENFVSLLKKVKQTTIEAHQHQPYPFGRLADELIISRQMNRHPFFDVFLVLQANQDVEFKPGDITTTQIELEKSVYQFDLVLEFWKKNGEISASLGYKTKLFKQETLEKLIDSYKTIAFSVIENPEIPLSEIKIISEIRKESEIKKIRDSRDVSFLNELKIVKEKDENEDKASFVFE
jgi:hypothetical protein